MRQILAGVAQLRRRGVSLGTSTLISLVGACYSTADVDLARPPSPPLACTVFWTCECSTADAELAHLPHSLLESQLDSYNVRPYECKATFVRRSLRL